MKYKWNLNKKFIWSISIISLVVICTLFGFRIFKHSKHDSIRNWISTHLSKTKTFRSANLGGYSFQYPPYYSIKTMSSSFMHREANRHWPSRVGDTMFKNAAFELIYMIYSRKSQPSQSMALNINIDTPISAKQEIDKTKYSHYMNVGDYILYIKEERRAVLPTDFQRISAIMKLDAVTISATIMCIPQNTKMFVEDLIRILKTLKMQTKINNKLRSDLQNKVDSNV